MRSPSRRRIEERPEDNLFEQGGDDEHAPEQEKRRSQTRPLKSGDQTCSPSERQRYESEKPRCEGRFYPISRCGRSC